MLNNSFNGCVYDGFQTGRLSRLEMEPSELYVYSSSKDKLELLGDILSYSKDWPLYVNYKDNWYQFEVNELMPDEAIGNYHGHSVYNQVNAEMVPEKYLNVRYYL